MNSWKFSELTVELTILMINSPLEKIVAIMLHQPIALIFIIEFVTPIESQL